MSGEDHEVVLSIHTLLSQYMKDREADRIISALATIMQDEKDGAELTRLFQKWLACS